MLIREAKLRLGVPVLCVAAMWVVAWVDLAVPGTFNVFGIRPRDPDGIWGVFLAPLLHGNLSHLIANTLPFLVLGWLIALRGLRDFCFVTAFVVIVGGGAVWLLGRSSIHIGASGVVFGYLGFLLARGFFERSAKAILLSIVAFVLYGGALLGVLPTDARVSWESHLFGALAGMAAARILTERHRAKVRSVRV